MAQSAAVIGLSAVGPQDEYIIDPLKTTKPEVRQHTHFTKFTRTNYPAVTKFIGQTVDFVLYPKQMGDMLLNATLAVTLPALPFRTNFIPSWTPMIGRALIEHIELRIGNTVIEKIDDYWYMIHDQLFLDADKKLVLYNLLNGGNNELRKTSTAFPLNLMIPLHLFFEKSALPVCALKENISIKIFFRPQSWFTDYTDPIELLSLTLITEESILTQEEKLYYYSNPQRFVIQKVMNNPVFQYNHGIVSQNLTADFAVTMMVWFVVPQKTTVNTRYTFGYTQSSSTNNINFSYAGESVAYVDQLLKSQIYINNRDITGLFGTGPFYRFKQPMDHGLTVPINNLYVYCFGNSPKKLNQGGYMDFSKLDAQTTKINLNFNPAVISNINTPFNFYLYYYGYQVLSISNGYVSLV